MILRLKRTPGLYIVGFMASGKTTLGRMLANEIGWGFADLDDDIEQREQQRVVDIFDQRGEKEFRRIEHELMRKRVRSIECGKPMVLALGGGAFVQAENFALLENNGVSLWLDCPLQVIEKRVDGTDRPLARDLDRMRELYAKRREFYALADHRVELHSEDPRENLAAILALPVFSE
jgi:shikimate kinase